MLAIKPYITFMLHRYRLKVKLEANNKNNSNSISILLEVKTLKLVVFLSIFFILSFIMQVITAGTGYDLSRKVWVTASKGDTYWAVNL